MGGRINTIMQVCFFALSGVLPREEAIDADQVFDQEDLRQERARKSSQMNIKAVDNTLAHLHEVPLPDRKSTAAGGLLPPVTANAPRFVQEVLGQIDRRRRRRTAGQRVSGRRHVPHRDGPIREAQPRAGDSRVGREDLHPMRQVRGDLSARDDPRQGLRRGGVERSAGDLQEHRRPRAGVEGHEVHAAGRGGGLHRLRIVRGRLPGARTRPRPSSRPSTCGRRRRCGHSERENWDFFLELAGSRTAARSS